MSMPKWNAWLGALDARIVEERAHGMLPVERLHGPGVGRGHGTSSPVRNALSMRRNSP